jgi:E3 ubiquitin-protein ligase NEDD4
MSKVNVFIPPFFSNNDITDVLDLTFSVEHKNGNHMEVIDLKDNGREIDVTEENKKEYVQ